MFDATGMLLAIIRVRVRSPQVDGAAGSNPDKSSSNNSAGTVSIVLFALPLFGAAGNESDKQVAANIWIWQSTRLSWTAIFQHRNIQKDKHSNNGGKVCVRLRNSYYQIAQHFCEH